MNFVASRFNSIERNIKMKLDTRLVVIEQLGKATAEKASHDEKYQRNQHPNLNGPPSARWSSIGRKQKPISSTVRPDRLRVRRYQLPQKQKKDVARPLGWYRSRSAPKVHCAAGRVQRQGKPFKSVGLITVNAVDRPNVTRGARFLGAGAIFYGKIALAPLAVLARGPEEISNPSGATAVPAVKI